MLFQIKLADKIIEIHSMYPHVYKFCKKYIVSDYNVLKPDIVVEICQEELDRELDRRCLIGRSNKNIEDKSSSMEQLETTVVYKKIAEAMLQYDTILMHGSVVATEGNGYMFTAPRGVGKTTRTMLWIRNIPGSIVVNGDKPLITVSANSIDVFGTPWSGKEGWNNNTSVPLRAIFLLERADEGENSLVEELSIRDAFSTLAKQTYQFRNTESIIHVLQLIKSFNNRVKLYRFRSTPTAEAARLAYETAKPHIL